MPVLCAAEMRFFSKTIDEFPVLIGRLATWRTLLLRLYERNKTKLANIVHRKHTSTLACKCIYICMCVFKRQVPHVCLVSYQLHIAALSVGLYTYVCMFVWICASLTLSVISFLENCLKLLGNWKSILWQRNETPINFNFRHALLRTSTPSWLEDEASQWRMAINLYALT